MRGIWGRALVASALVAGCVRLDDAPVFPQDDPNFSAPQEVEPEGVDEDPARPLTLMPGDVLAIQAFSTETTEYDGIVVDDRGTVHVPLAGDVDVGGLTLAAAADRIQEAMRRMDRVVRIGLRISAPLGHMASVLGAVGDAGRVQLTPGMRVGDLLAAAGGPGPVVEGGTVPPADIAGARLVRNGQALPISVQLALEGQPRHNIRVQPGDHLYVPFARGRTITVLGAVGAPGVFAYRRGLRLTEILARAGGLNERGDRTDVHIVRGSLRQPQAYRASLRAIVNGNSSDVTLAAGDVVYVTEEWTAHMGEVLARIAPLLADPATVGLAIGLSQ
ncbi:MAG: SLBB domain-containing protein [Myxococcota bacterium]